MTFSRAAHGEIIVHAILLANFAITPQGGSFATSQDQTRLSSPSPCGASPGIGRCSMQVRSWANLRLSSPLRSGGSPGAWVLPPTKPRAIFGGSMASVLLSSGPAGAGKIPNCSGAAGERDNADHSGGFYGDFAMRFRLVERLPSGTFPVRTVVENVLPLG